MLNDDAKKTFADALRNAGRTEEEVAEALASLDEAEERQKEQEWENSLLPENDPYVRDDFPHTLIRVTDSQGNVTEFPNATIVGIWDGRILINSTSEAMPKEFNGMQVTAAEVQSTWIQALGVDRLEFGAYSPEDSATRQELDAGGHLGEDDHLTAPEQDG